MKQISVILCLGFLFIAGCSKPKIDATSDETLKASIEKVRESLPEGNRKEFDEAIQVLAFSNLDLGTVFSDAMSGTNTSVSSMKDALAGKTGFEVIQEAEKLKVERQAKEKEQALQEIKELEEKRIKAEEARSQLSSFKITRSRFYKRRREYLGPEPIIELTVQNETKFPVSRAYFTGTLASPGRAVPWLKDQFNYEISGGLEPGEKATWSLAPNMFSDWGKVEAPKDAVLTVTVEQLDGADGESLFSRRDFDDNDMERLTSLKKEYGIQ